MLLVPSVPQLLLDWLLRLRQVVSLTGCPVISHCSNTGAPRTDVVVVVVVVVVAGRYNAPLLLMLLLLLLREVRHT